MNDDIVLLIAENRHTEAAILKAQIIGTFLASEYLDVLFYIQSQQNADGSLTHALARVRDFISLELDRLERGEE